jgi:integrase
MPVYKRDGVWYARAQVGSQRVERSAGAGASQAEAKELEESLRRRLREDRHARRTGASLNRKFGEALLHYMKLPETNKLKSYQSLKSKASLIRPYLEDYPLEQTPEAAEEMKQALISEDLQNATINRRLALVRRILKLCHQWKWLTHPLSITLLPEDNERHIYPEVESVYELADKCRPDDGDAVLVIYFTGIRKGEFLKINRNPERYVHDGFIELYTGNKTKKPGRIPILQPIKSIIERMPLDVTSHSLRVSFEKARNAVGMPYLHLHDLRHGFASNIIESGGDLVDVMKVLRHSSSQTSKRYAHLHDKRLRRIAGRVARMAEKRRAQKTVIKHHVLKSA